jgi:hypothetical protein
MKKKISKLKEIDDTLQYLEYYFIDEPNDFISKTKNDYFRDFSEILPPDFEVKVLDLLKQIFFPNENQNDKPHDPENQMNPKPFTQLRGFFNGKIYLKKNEMLKSTESEKDMIKRIMSLNNNERALDLLLTRIWDYICLFTGEKRGLY